jgi:hypothetical protein
MSGLRRFDTNNHLLKTLPSQEKAVSNKKNENKMPGKPPAVSIAKARFQDKGTRRKLEPTKAPIGRVREPDSVDAAPLSSESESDDPSPSGKTGHRRLDGGRDDSPNRADIAPTFFRKPARANCYRATAPKSLSLSQSDSDHNKKRKRSTASSIEDKQEDSLLSGRTRGKIYSDPSFMRRLERTTSSESSKEKKQKQRIKGIPSSCLL